LLDLCLPHLQRAGRLPEALDESQRTWTGALVALYQDKLRSASDIVGLTDLFFQAEVTEEEDEAKVVLAEEQVPAVLRTFAELVGAMETFEVDGIKAAIKAVQQATGFKGKQLFMPIRAALTGQTHGPDLNQTIVLLGKNKVLERLQARIG